MHAQLLQALAAIADLKEENYRLWLSLSTLTEALIARGVIDRTELRDLSAALEAADAAAALPATMPGIAAESMPGSVAGVAPQPVPGSVPESMSGSVPTPMPGSVPTPVPGSVPTPMSGSVPTPVPGSVPTPIRGSVPRSVPMAASPPTSPI